MEIIEIIIWAGSMELKILDSIMHGELKPWKLDVSDTRRFTELVKSARGVSPRTYAELISQLRELLASYPTLSKLLSEIKPTHDNLQQLLYHADLPEYIDPITSFYSRIITSETLRVYNSIKLHVASLSKPADVQYQVGKVLTSIRVLAKQTATELSERGFTSVPGEQSNFIHFALFYLMQSLIQLYFSVQKSFESSMRQISTLDDFYILDLDLPRSQIHQLVYLENLGKEEAQELIIQTQIEQLHTENIEIEKIEMALRKFIINALSIKTVAEFKQVIPGHIQEKIDAAIEKEKRINPAISKDKIENVEYLLQFSDLRHLQDILVARLNWEKVEDVFGTKENLAAEFNNLAGLRNPVRHSREIDEASLLKGKAAIIWFKQQLQLE